MHARSESRRIGIRHVVLLAAMLVAAACEPSASPSPTPTAAPTSVTESPGTAPPGPTGAGSVCDLLTEERVGTFLGGDVISATDRPASGEVLLGGCEWIATNSTSLRIDLRVRSSWEQGTTGPDWEQVGDDPNARFSDISGLAYLAPDLDAYILVRVGPSQDVQVHIEALTVFLGG